VLLGIDTGGTFTDAVLVRTRDVQRAANGSEPLTAFDVLVSAKAPTTHHDLTIGVTGAVDAVLAAARAEGIDETIDLVSLSTTLATNALVEGRGRPVGAVIIGFDQGVVERGGLDEAIGDDPVIFLDGGHDPHGSPRSDLDLDHLDTRLDAVLAASAPDAWAVMSQFSVRNPEHELAVRDVLRARTGRPVSCSHHLSARLDGPRRAVTAILNARLIGVIDDLVATVERALAERNIDAPLMVVRGDGSLVSAAFVRDRPIETILSGPAASIVGAAHLTGHLDAIVADIGGTTTDIAVLRAGVPVVSERGAVVGGHATMVQAVAMSTHGLGGDSEVRHDARAAGPALVIGPRKVIPLCALASEHPDTAVLVRRMLERQLLAIVPHDLDGVVIVAEQRDQWIDRLDGAERQLLVTLGGRLAVAADAVPTMVGRRILDRLVRRGVVRLAAASPTDASHVLGTQQGFDVAAATAALTLLARRRDRFGADLATDATTAARLVVDAVVRRSADAVLAAALEHDGLPADLVSSPLVTSVLDRRTDPAGSTDGTLSRPVVDLPIRLSIPLVGLGAAASCYHPAVGTLLATEVIVPEHAGVANAVGAVVGSVRIQVSATISSPERGRYLVHASDADVAPVHVTVLDDAIDAARVSLRDAVQAAMVAAGAPAFDLAELWEHHTVDVGGVDMFVDGTLTLTATGRPELRP
jgi:N-methylhydantoinase A/oxoprolinase/acetone carboxylase beta subunit